MKNICLISIDLCANFLYCLRSKWWHCIVGIIYQLIRVCRGGCDTGGRCLPRWVWYRRAVPAEAAVYRRPVSAKAAVIQEAGVCRGGCDTGGQSLLEAAVRQEASVLGLLPRIISVLFCDVFTYTNVHCTRKVYVVSSRTINGCWMSQPPAEPAMDAECRSRQQNQQWMLNDAAASRTSNGYWMTQPAAEPVADSKWSGRQQNQSRIRMTRPPAEPVAALNEAAASRTGSGYEWHGRQQNRSRHWMKRPPEGCRGY